MKMEIQTQKSMAYISISTAQRSIAKNSEIRPKVNHVSIHFRTPEQKMQIKSKRNRREIVKT